MLNLYMRPGCAFSKKVVDFAQEQGINLVLKDIREPENEAYLMANGGTHETPYLVDEERGESLYDSGKIVSYLTERYAN